VLLGLLIAMVAAWWEQSNRNRGLCGRPDVALVWIAQGDKKPECVVKNTGDFAAVNIVSTRIVGTDWEMKFGTVDHLSNVDVPGKYLTYTVDPNETFNFGKVPAVFPMTLTFSNLGEPKRYWHTHYEIAVFKGGRIVSHHKSYSELYLKKKTLYCEACGYAR